MTDNRDFAGLGDRQNPGAVYGFEIFAAAKISKPGSINNGAK